VRTTKFPIGAGYVVPSYLVLVPMLLLLLLPPSTVPLSTAAGLLTGFWCALGRGPREAPRAAVCGPRRLACTS
jgi:hypothetical protein